MYTRYSNSLCLIKTIKSLYLSQGTEGLLFVVDSSDVTRIQEAREEMMGILRDEGMEQACPVVVSFYLYKESI